MLRSAVSEGTAIGRQAAAIMERGELVPDQLVVDLIAGRISQPDAAGGFILDGFPRTVVQAERLDEALDGHELNCVLELKVDEPHLLDRILGRAMQARSNGEKVRADDNEEALSVRLTAYANQTKPLTDYYAAKGLLRTIDASQPVDHVTAALAEAIGMVSRATLCQRLSERGPR